MVHSPKEPESPDSTATGCSERISSQVLGAQIVDALLRADIVKASDVEKAIRIAAEEIEVRKSMGDY